MSELLKTAKDAMIIRSMFIAQHSWLQYPENRLNVKLSSILKKHVTTVLGIGKHITIDRTVEKSGIGRNYYSTSIVPGESNL